MLGCISLAMLFYLNNTDDTSVITDCGFFGGAEFLLLGDNVDVLRLLVHRVIRLGRHREHSELFLADLFRGLRLHLCCRPSYRHLSRPVELTFAQLKLRFICRCGGVAVAHAHQWHISCCGVVDSAVSAANGDWYFFDFHFDHIGRLREI